VIAAPATKAPYGHEFRYIVTGSKVLPTLKALHEVAARLLSAARNVCALNATLHFAVS
jgi:hypothetical protein